LPEFLTGREFIKFFIEINGEKIRNPLDIDEYFRKVAFDPTDGDRLIKEYSHGMMNKLQMLISLYIMKPPVILLDEPLTSFDVVAALEVKNMIKAIKSDHIIIFSTHILQLAQDLCDEIVVLHEGQLRHVPAEKIHSPQFESDIIEILSENNGTTAPVPDMSIAPDTKENETNG
jgi:ABC-2 type transport system ATP-binding protein